MGLYNVDWGWNEQRRGVQMRRVHSGEEVEIWGNELKQIGRGEGRGVARRGEECISITKKEQNNENFNDDEKEMYCSPRQKESTERMRLNSYNEEGAGRNQDRLSELSSGYLLSGEKFLVLTQNKVSGVQNVSRAGSVRVQHGARQSHWTSNHL